MTAVTCPGCGAADKLPARRPWCLSCCDDLDRELCDMTPFGS